RTTSGPLAKNPGQSVTIWSAVRLPALPPRLEEARPGFSSTNFLTAATSPARIAATSADASLSSVISLASFPALLWRVGLTGLDGGLGRAWLPAQMAVQRRLP